MAVKQPENRLSVLQAAAGVLKGDCDQHLTLGLALREAGDLAGALRQLRRAVAIDPEHALAHYNLGIVLYDLKRLEDAASSYRRALQIDPDLSPAVIQRIKVLGELADWSLADPEAELRRLRVDGRFPQQPFTSLFFVDDPVFQRELAERYSAHMAAGLGITTAGKHREEMPTGKLRVGFFSSDMHDHPVAKLSAQFLECFDRERFTTVLFDYGPDDGSQVRRRIESAVDRFIALQGADDHAIMSALSDANLDILIDLKGHTGTKTHLLSARPAAVQIGWMGYPGTSGAPWIDHVFADSFLVPERLEHGYSEKIVHLPDFYCPYDTTIPVSMQATRADHGFEADDIILCAFCQILKLRPVVFAAWMEALRRQPRARLWLPTLRPRAWDNICRRARDAGVDPARIVQAPRIDAADHMERYRIADLSLDTYPYGAHTTALDALYCACPVLACVGESFSSRVAGSALNAAGLPDFVARGPDAYRAKLLDLVLEPGRLAHARTYLAGSLARERLFDTARFTRNFQDALENVWKMRNQDK